MLQTEKDSPWWDADRGTWIKLTLIWFDCLTCPTCTINIQNKILQSLLYGLGVYVTKPGKYAMVVR